MAAVVRPPRRAAGREARRPLSPIRPPLAAVGEVARLLEAATSGGRPPRLTAADAVHARPCKLFLHRVQLTPRVAQSVVAAPALRRQVAPPQARSVVPARGQPPPVVVHAPGAVLAPGRARYRARAPRLPTVLERVPTVVAVAAGRAAPAGPRADGPPIVGHGPEARFRPPVPASVELGARPRRLASTNGSGRADAGAVRPTPRRVQARRFTVKLVHHAALPRPVRL